MAILNYIEYNYTGKMGTILDEIAKIDGDAIVKVTVRIPDREFDHRTGVLLDSDHSYNYVL